MRTEREIRATIAMIRHLGPQLPADCFITLAGASMALDWALGDETNAAMFSPDMLRKLCGDEVFPKSLEQPV